MKHPKTWSILASLGMVVAVCMTLPTPTVSAPMVDQAMSETDAAIYSNERFTELVKKYSVNNGEQMDYAAWQDSPEDLAALDRQIALLAAVSPKSHPEQFPGKTARKSYWINTYNTLVLHAVLEYWPLDSVRDVKLSFGSRIIRGKGFFYDRKVTVGGEVTNLYDLEKEVLKQQKDPRLHFALNCASNSCPALRPTDWTDEQLDLAARDFVNDPANVTVRKKAVYLSSIFKWYKKDFPKDAVKYLQQYAEPELEKQLQEARDAGYRTRYVKYDWDLNDADDGSVNDGG
jgi:hypothetical protein